MGTNFYFHLLFSLIKRIIRDFGGSPPNFWAIVAIGERRVTLTGQLDNVFNVQ